MAKGTVVDEISVLKFFEDGPVEKAEVVFNIVAEKMRERLRSKDESGDAMARSTVRQRQARPNAEKPHAESASPSNG